MRQLHIYSKPQAPTQIEALLGGTLGEQSEDCLYLNIWTPGCDAAKRPVMVWIHGGAFVIGAGSQGITTAAIWRRAVALSL